MDIFSVPPRVSTPWEKETVGRFAGMHTVAEMKRTRRRKDWDQATALGLAMLQYLPQVTAHFPKPID